MVSNFYKDAKLTNILGTTNLSRENIVYFTITDGGEDKERGGPYVIRTAPSVFVMSAAIAADKWL